MARMMDLKTGTEYVIRNWVCANLQETYTDLMNSAKDADFIIAGEGVVAARLVAEKLGIPWAFAVLQPASFLSAYDPSVIPVFPFLAKMRGLGSIVNRGIIQLSKVIAKSWAEPIHQLRRELGLPPLVGNPFINDKYSPYLVLAMFSSAFAKPQPDWAANTVVTGFAFYDGSEGGAELIPELKQFLDTGEPPIVFTLGSAVVMTPGSFYQESIQAAKQLNRRAVLLIGKNTPAENLSQDILAVSYVPYSQIFPRACAIVHQGGIGTTAQALRVGRPTIVMPYSHDQPDNAARVERLGTSRTISRKHYLASRVAKTLGELLENPNYATKAAEIGRIIQAENGIGIACDAIEKQLQSI
jgi:UDP:flavonoid glycosyltransferase YjiC (YdhE family)